MASFAFTSLLEMIHRHSSHVSDSDFGSEFQYLFENIEPLFELIKQISEPERSRSSRGDKFVAEIDRQLKEALTKLLDALESCLLYQYHFSEILGDLQAWLMKPKDQGFDAVGRDIRLFVDTVNKIKEEYDTENEDSRNWLQEDDVDVRSTIGNNSKVVGLDDELEKLTDRLTTDNFKYSRVLPIHGMAGIGKTTLAKEIYQDPFILSHFEIRVWVTVGPKYNLKQILLAILAQTNPTRTMDTFHFDNDTELAQYVHTRLEGKRYLLVLDDIWDMHLLCMLPMSSKNDSSGARIILTTRIGTIADYNPYDYDYDRNKSSLKRCENVHNKQFLNKEESWKMFLEKVFAEDLCPGELEKAGRKIVENCEGLAFAIIVVGKHLSKAEKTLEYWNKVAEKKINVFDDPEDEEVISSSYKYLYKHLQYFFLYMGVFPQGYEIPTSKLIQLFCSEGLILITSEESGTTRKVAMEPLEQLVCDSCVLVRQMSCDGTIKTCGLHYIFQHLCISEARKENFFHVLSNYADSFTQDIRSHRRLCIHNNILFGIKDIYESIASIRNARSILCTGPYHQYAVPMCFGLKMLKVIDAVTIRFYNFPIQVLKLLMLRHLSLTYDGKLPRSISKLQRLQCLIVQRHVNIKSRGDMPLDIWDMKELRHLQVMGSDLPNSRRGANLPNLEVLIGVSSISCTTRVLSCLPSLQKLGIQIISSLDSVENFCIFNHFPHVNKLQNIKCVVMNPWEDRGLRCQVVSTKPYTYNLKKLSLSGLGYPWEYMSEISTWEWLKVLKLRCCAFRGPEWTTSDGGFPLLKFLLLEDLDLTHWTAGYNCFRSLETLIIRHCYKLEKIPSTIGGKLEKIELVDARHSVELCVTEMLQQRGHGNGEPLVSVRQSLDDKKLKS